MEKIISKAQILDSKNYFEIFEKIYGNVASSNLVRYVDLYDEHVKRFSSDGWFFSSSGRIEVIGNHTDHNNGKVLTASISVDTLAFVSQISEKRVCISSCGYPVFSVDLANLDADKSEQGTSVSLVKGVAKWFLDNGLEIGGFEATMVSGVFKGAGVSSSASFEVLIAEIFNQLYNDGNVSKMQKAIASQFAENIYFGKPCGLMDQSAIALGGISMIDFKDTSKPEVESFAWPFADEVDIFIVNTGGDHSDLTDNYSAIRSEMEAVAKCFNQHSLRFVDKQEFLRLLPDLQTKVSGRAILRAMHYYDENERVEKAVECLKNKDIDGFMKIVNQSGESSYTMLQNCYAETDKAQRIPLALAIAKNQKGVMAARVHGGGFMGTILAFVKKSYSNAFSDALKPVFGADNIFKLTIRDVGATEVEI